PSSIFLLFFSTCSADHRDLHSFPTRRSSDLEMENTRGVRPRADAEEHVAQLRDGRIRQHALDVPLLEGDRRGEQGRERAHAGYGDRKSTRLNSSHRTISYAVFCLKKKKQKIK